MYSWLSLPVLLTLIVLIMYAISAKLYMVLNKPRGSGITSFAPTSSARVLRTPCPTLPFSLLLVLILYMSLFTSMISLSPDPPLTQSLHLFLYLVNGSLSKIWVTCRTFSVSKFNPPPLALSQRKYMMALLSRANMSDAKPVATPMEANTSLTLGTGTALDNPTEYRALVGSLQYLSLTRPDVAFTVNRLSQFMHRPTCAHWKALKRLLRYLLGTLHYGLNLFRDSPNTLHAFSDADWAGDKDDFISTGAYIVYLGRNVISWSSKKQRSVARSSTEAEYRSVAHTAAELLGSTMFFLSFSSLSLLHPLFTVTMLVPPLLLLTPCSTLA